MIGGAAGVWAADEMRTASKELSVGRELKTESQSDQESKATTVCLSKFERD
jgi:hypothetical protein